MNRIACLEFQIKSVPVKNNITAGAKSALLKGVKIHFGKTHRGGSANLDLLLSVTVAAQPIASKAHFRRGSGVIEVRNRIRL